MWKFPTSDRATPSKVREIKTVLQILIDIYHIGFLLQCRLVFIFSTQITVVFFFPLYLNHEPFCFFLDYQRLGKLLSLNHFGAANTEVQALKVKYCV